MNVGDLYTLLPGWVCPSSGISRQMWETKDGEQHERYRAGAVLSPCRQCIDKALSLKTQDGPKVANDPKKNTRLQEAALCALLSMIYEFEEVKERKWEVTDEYFQNVVELYDSLSADGVDLTGLESEIYAINSWIDGDG